MLSDQVRGDGGVEISLGAVFVPRRKRRFLRIGVAGGKQEMLLGLEQINDIIILVAPVKIELADLHLERKIDLVLFLGFEIRFEGLVQQAFPKAFLAQLEEFPGLGQQGGIQRLVDRIQPRLKVNPHAEMSNSALSLVPLTGSPLTLRPQRYRPGASHPRSGHRGTSRRRWAKPVCRLPPATP